MSIKNNQGVLLNLAIGFAIVFAYYIVHLKFGGPTKSLQFQMAEDFSIPVIKNPGNQSQADGFFSLGDFSGDTLLINFWASWCGICRNEKPYLDSLWQNHRGGSLKILGIATQDSGNALSQLETLKHMSYAIAWDSSGEVFRKYAIEGVPQSVLIDPTGKVIMHIKGPIGPQQLADLDQRIAQLDQSATRKM